MAVFTRWVGSGAKPGMCSLNASEAFAFNPASLYFILLQCDSLLALILTIICCDPVFYPVAVPAATREGASNSNSRNRKYYVETSDW
ncbi:hypothetical protein F8M41_025162 [Gigaspora margarita]|uniref:Uncharacterized protein n=1 Tax=Gigaspora margarita TaxID=4874 RepID=A0A8H3XMX5_GIGMA|nr:hypothetical protein F8M41_025162 [Gigaspora margarita]